LKIGDIREKTRIDLAAVVWKDKRDVCLLTNIHDPHSEGNYHDEHGNAIKPAIVADFKHHMRHVVIADKVANSYSPVYIAGPNMLDTATRVAAIHLTTRFPHNTLFNTLILYTANDRGYVAEGLRFRFSLTYT
jgi:hypothetical protein